MRRLPTTDERGSGQRRHRLRRASWLVRARTSRWTKQRTTRGGGAARGAGRRSTQRSRQNSTQHSRQNSTQDSSWSAGSVDGVAPLSRHDASSRRSSRGQNARRAHHQRARRSSCLWSRCGSHPEGTAGHSGRRSLVPIADEHPWTDMDFRAGRESRCAMNVPWQQKRRPASFSETSSDLLCLSRDGGT